MNNQIKPKQGAVKKYTISADSCIKNYPVSNKAISAVEEVNRSEQGETTEQRRAREALKVSNPFKGV